jgi:radical SAM protein with 4Fe4S-binding SPASM domain
MPDKILPPTLVSFAITRQCNLRCKHCYAESGDSPHPDELSTTGAKRVIQEIAALGTRFLVFDGGEPLMRPDIYELIAWARELGLQPFIGSNATLLSTETVDKLKKVGVRIIAISLDGAEAKSHDEFRGREGSWERAVAGIRNVIAAGIPFQISSCIHRHNLTQFEAIASRAREWKALGVEIFDYVLVGRAKRNRALELSPLERRSLVAEIIQHQLRDKEMIYRCIAIPQFWVEVDRTVLDGDEAVRFTRSCCGAGLRYCAVFYDGTVYPCVLLHKSAGNVRDHSFTDIWHKSEVLALLRDRDRLEGKCGRCRYRYVCGGARCRVYEKTGSLTRTDESCWFEEEEVKGDPAIVARYRRSEAER